MAAVTADLAVQPEVNDHANSEKGPMGKEQRYFWYVLYRRDFSLRRKGGHAPGAGTLRDK